MFSVILRVKYQFPSSQNQQRSVLLDTFVFTGQTDGPWVLLFDDLRPDPAWLCSFQYDDIGARLYLNTG